MRTSIVAIGNSKGIRIPKPLLEESGIVKEVEIKVVRGGLRIAPVKPSRTITHIDAKLSEKSLARDWAQPDEDEAWKSL